MSNKKVIINTDGGAKGNPGPAAIGAVININGEEKQYNKKIGETTNNVAEYKAIIFALDKLKKLIGKKESRKIEIEIRSDSELVVNQMNGNYKVNEEKLKDLFVDLWNTAQNFKSVTYKHVPREKNKAADKLVKDLLNTLI